MKLYLIPILSLSLFGSQSVTVTSGGSGSPGSAVYLGAPFNNLGSFRMEWRFDALQASSNTSQLCPIGLCASIAQGFSISTGNIPYDTLSGQQYLSINVSSGLETGATVLVRVTRDVVGTNCAGATSGCYVLEAWELQPTFQYWSTTRNIVTANNNWTTGFSQTAFSGGVVANTEAFVRWFSGDIVAGQGTSYCGSASPTGPCIPNISSSYLGTYGSWEFEGNLSDTNTGGYGPYNLLPTTGVSYSTTPTFNPICNAGSQQAFKIGVSGSLSGTGLPLDGGSTISASWTKIAGPSGLTITGNTTFTPTVSGMVSTMVLGGSTASVPSYIFQLVVTDGSSSSTICTVKDGAVPTNSSDIVISGNSTVDKIVHQQLRYGSSNNPIPWYDTTNYSMINGFLQNVYNLPPYNNTSSSPTGLGGYFQPWWTLQIQSGTIAVSGGSASVVGTNTSFLTALNCIGGNAPANTLVAIEYTGGSSVLPATLHYSAFGIATCADNTHITLAQNWNSSRGTPTGRYAVDLGGQYQSNSDGWSINSNATAPANFYDDAEALFIFYLRTGIDDYYNAFITFSNEWWMNPSMDQGASFVGYSGSGPSNVCQGFAWRAYSENGIVLLGLMRGDTKCADSSCSTGTGVWPGLRNVYDYTTYFWSNSGQASMGDRETAHQLNITGYCVHFDPYYTLPGISKTCQSFLDSTLQTSVTQYWQDPSTGGILDGPWGFSGSTAVAPSTMVSSSSASQDGTSGWCSSSSPHCYGTSISLVNGSSAVHCNDGTQGGACNWVVGSYPAGMQQNAYLWVLNDPYTPYLAVGFWPGIPANYQTAGDVVGYQILTVSDAHDGVLNQAYQGTTGTHQYIISYHPNNSGINGYYIQPYMAGIVGDAFYRVGDWLSLIGDSNASTAYNFGKAESNFNRQYAIDPSLGGAAYVANSLNCYPYTASYPHDGNCDAPGSIQTPDGARILNPETSMAGNAEYIHDFSSAQLTFLDNVFGKAFAKPGTCTPSGTICNPDGSYINCLDPGQYCSTWGGGDTPWKWLGQFFGSSLAGSYLATRLTGAPSSSTVIQGTVKGQIIH